MRVLVTGVAGYIGSVTAAQLLASGYTVVGADDLSTGHLDAVPAGVEFYQLPITALGDVFAAGPIDAVVHFAAKSLVGESMLEPAAYWHNNVGGTLHLLDAMRAHAVDRIVFSSSAATYGEVARMPIPETAPARPTSTYGATKLAVDLALASYAHAYGLGAVSLRYFNVAGALRTPDGRGYGERHVPETHLIPLALRAAAGAESTLSVFGADHATPDGTCVRDYVHVVDLADAHVRALHASTPGTHRVVNLGSGTGYSVRQVLDTVRDVTGCDVTVVDGPPRAGDPAELVAANAYAAELLGWRPTRGLRQMVADAWAVRSVQP
jgi:UDP-glucose 4-epimerase